MMKNLLLILAVLLSYSTIAQITNESYFQDTTYGYLDYVFDRIEMEDGIVLSGRIQNGSIQEPVMLKIDLNGNVIWSTFNEHLLGELSVGSFEINLFDDGFIYGFFRVNATQWGEKRKICKVNPANGHVEYITNFYDGSDRRIDMADYNDSVFVALYTNYYNSADNAHIAFMNKLTGDTIATKFITNLSLTIYTQSIHVAVDKSKNIYYAIDHRLSKLNKGDFDFVLWTRDYSTLPIPIEVANELYFDAYDQLFFMGHRGTAGPILEYPTVVKVNKETGLKDWHYTVPIPSSYTSDFADDQDYIYTTYNKNITGVDNVGLRVVKLRKSDGNVEWNVGAFTTVLGSGAIDNAESSVSVDVDCDGDVYVTGFYNLDLNYGAWSVQKLSGLDGAKIDEYTITEDSSQVDSWSRGLASIVIRDTAYIIGQLQTTLSSSFLSSLAYFVSIDPNSGDIMNRHFIYGGYQHLSKTLDIVNHNDTMYVLKQVGERGLVEAYNMNNNLMWQKYLNDTHILKAGQISVNDHSVIVSAQVNLSDGSVPYYSNDCEKIVMYKMNHNGGGFLFNEVPMLGVYCKLLELESDLSGNYILYKKDNDLILRKWIFPGGGFGAELIVEQASVNTQFEGNINIMFNYNSDSLLIVGSSQLYWYNKTNASLSNAYTFPDQRDYYDHLIVDSIMYIAGSNSSGQQTVTALDFVQSNLIWDEFYANGTLTGIDDDFHHKLYVTGIEDTTLVAHKISQMDGSLMWNYTVDPNLYSGSKPLDIVVNQFKGYIAIAGTNSLGVNHQDGLIILLNFAAGDTLFTHFLEDLKMEVSEGYCIGISKDSLTWIGGAHNRYPQLREGFLHQLNFDLDTCGISSENVVETLCINYISPLGSIWNTSGIYTETIPSVNGCDSTITFNITIPVLTTTVTQVDNILTSDAIGATYQWVDCDNNDLEIPGASNQEYIASQNGNYAVIVNEGSCSDTSACYLVNTLGIQESLTNIIKCYPNPVEDNLHISNPNGAMIMMRLVDPLGRTVYNDAMESNETIIDMKYFASGIYLLLIQSGSNSFIYKIQKN